MINQTFIETNDVTDIYVAQSQSFRAFDIESIYICNQDVADITLTMFIIPADHIGAPLPKHVAVINHTVTAENTWYWTDAESAKPGPGDRIAIQVLSGTPKLSCTVNYEIA